MPPSILPVEIIDNIIARVAQGSSASYIQDLLSCCLASRAFVHPSQQRIFRHATLLSPPVARISRSNLVVHTETYAMFSRTLHFVNVVTANPRLGEYVEDLTYELTSVPHYASEKDRKDRDIILGAIPLLPNVTAFTLGVHNPEEDVSLGLAISMTDLRTEHAVLTLLRRPKVQVFSLRFISDFDIDFLNAIMSAVSHISLFRCSLAGLGSDDEEGIDGALELYRPRARLLSERLHLGSLSCDASSLERCCNVYLRLEAERIDATPAPGSLSHLEQLHLSFSDDSEPDAHIPLLKQAANLRHLTITRASYSLSWIWDNKILLLNDLHPSSFHTITDLTLNTIFTLENDPDSEGDSDSDDSMNADPSSSQEAIPDLVLETILPKLTSLQSLHLTIMLQGYLPPGGERDTLVGAQWTKLCAILCTHANESDLKAIFILVHIRALDYYAADAYLANARELRRCFRERVYPAQFEDLDKRGREGELRFSFQVEVSVGDRVAELTGRTCLLV